MRVNTCIEWVGATQKGYGAVRWEGKNVRVHRLVCEMANGPAPEGKPNALHSCHNKRCINPVHLRWGDQRDNYRDSNPHVLDGHCAQGHPLVEGNLYVAPSGRAVCRECRKRIKREWARKARTA